jgi:hypothetical protein
VAADLIRVEIPRRVQPQDSFDLAAEIRGYASSCMLGSAGAQTIDGRPITFGGGLTIGPTGQGLAYVGDGTDNIAYATPARNFVFGTDKDFTFVIVARKNSAGTNGAGIGGMGATGGGTGNTQFALFGSSTNANAVRMVAVDASGDVFLNTDCTAFGWDDTNWHVIVVKGRVAHASSDSGRAVYFADGKQLNTASGLSDTTPDATTFNVVNVCAVRRGGSSIVAGPYTVALCLPLIGAQMPDEWCRRASADPWGTCFEPRHVWVPMVTAAAGSHAASGALASDAATIAGTAAHLTLHTSTGALASDEAAIAGTAAHLTLHTTEGALASDAAVIAGTADHAAGGEHPTEGALSSDAAAIAGTAAHLTLHTTTGALAADAATVAGTATHLLLHTSTGALAAEAATMAGTAVHSGAGAEIPRNVGAGRARKPQRRRVIEVDGQDVIVGSTEEAQALFDHLRERATKAAAVAVDRAAKATRRPARKVLADARNSLRPPVVTAPPDLAEMAAQALGDIRSTYRDAMASVEIAALLARRQREEEDDEDVLLLIA